MYAPTINIHGCSRVEYDDEPRRIDIGKTKVYARDVRFYEGDECVLEITAFFYGAFAAENSLPRSRTDAHRETYDEPETENAE